MGGRGSAGAGGWSGEKVLKNAPALTGSEKQIAWANDLRKDFVEYYAADISKVGPRRERWFGKEEADKWVKANQEAVSIAVNQMTQAKTWITTRNFQKQDPWGGSLVDNIVEWREKGLSAEKIGEKLAKWV